MTHDRVTAGLDAYIVGGAVRDTLIGLPAGDQDWVVVGATPEDMVARGFTPVGGDFPVFLHPQTHEEYALARTERKSGRGYHGFTFYTGADVTLEQDLKRRDLTVNAMARTQSGELIDPLNGLSDLKARVFRHVGPAFKEDPVRILRLARFLARFTTFTVATETQALCQTMVQSGEVDALVSERVWQEIAKGLLAEKPSRMFEFLKTCGACDVIMPEWVATERVMTKIDQLKQSIVVSNHIVTHLTDRACKAQVTTSATTPEVTLAISQATASQADLAARFALLVLDSPERVALCQRLRVPREVSDAAKLLAHIVHVFNALATPKAEDQLALIEKCDALRRPERFIKLIHLSAWVTGVTAQFWLVALQKAQAVDAGAVARLAGKDTEKIREAVRAARLEAIKASN